LIEEFDKKEGFAMAERARTEKIQPIAPKKTGLEKVLDTVERVGNRVPHPAVIFVMLIVTVRMSPT
jgi:p-aminobenzoyl-glutamate transporter AbgT